MRARAGTPAVVVPVSDVDRAKAFHAERIGFNPDHDATSLKGLRLAVVRNVQEAEPGWLGG